MLPPSSTQSRSDEFLRICQQRVKAWETQGYLKRAEIPPEQLSTQVAGIIARNCASGRIRRVTRWQKSPAAATTPHDAAPFDDPETSGAWPMTEDAPSEAYIDRVITFYLKEHRRVEKLAARDGDEWDRLFKELTGRANQLLLRQNPAARTRQEATDFAQESCLAIFSCPFPYDVPFEAWATKILINFILRRYTRSQDLIDRTPEMISLDHPAQNETDDDFSLYDLLMDEAGAAVFKQVEVQEWLLQAIAQLHSPMQQQVIIDSIFYNLSDEHIAQRLSKTKNAVQILRHRALQGLKQILEA